MRRLLLIILLTILTAIPSSTAEETTGDVALFPVRVKGKWGYINRNGEIVIEPQFEWTLDFNEGHGSVKAGGKYGLVNAAGEFVIKPDYEWIGTASEGLVTIKDSNSQYGYADVSGATIVNPQFEWARTFSEGLAACGDASGTFFIDHSGQIVLNLPYNSAENLHEGRSVFFDGVNNGVIDRQGREIVPSIYSHITDYSGGVAVATKNTGWYRYANFILDLDGNVIARAAPREAMSYNGFNDGLCKADSKVEQYYTLTGYVDITGAWKIPPSYKWASDFTQGRAMVQDRSGEALIIDRNGDVLTHTGFVDAWIIPRIVDDGLFQFRPNSLYGIVDRDFKLTIMHRAEPAYLFEEKKANGYCQFRDGLLAVRLRPGNNCGFVDTDGRIVVETTGLMNTLSADRAEYTFSKSMWLFGYQLASGALVNANGVETRWPPLAYFDGFSEGLAAADTRFAMPVSWVFSSFNGCAGYIDRDGNWVIEPRFEETRGFKNGYAKVKLSGKWGLIDKEGVFVIPPKYEDIRECGIDTLRAVENSNNLWGYLGLDGEWLIEPRLTWADEFSEGLCHIAENGKHGFISPKGIELIPRKYDCAGNFSEGLAPVSLNNKWGFIDRLNRWIIEPQWDGAESFAEGRAGVWNFIPGGEGAQEWFIIDRTGKQLNEANLSWMDPYSEGFAAVRIGSPPFDDYWEYVNLDGNLVSDLHLKKAYPFCEGFAVVGIPDMIGYMDVDGNVIWPPTY